MLGFVVAQQAEGDLRRNPVLCGETRGRSVPREGSSVLPQLFCGEAASRKLCCSRELPALLSSRELQQNNYKKGANRGKAVTAILSLNIELLQAMEGTEISPFKIRKVFSPVMKAGQSAEDQGKPYYTKNPSMSQGVCWDWLLLLISKQGGPWILLAPL